MKAAEGIAIRAHLALLVSACELQIVVNSDAPKTAVKTRAATEAIFDSLSAFATAMMEENPFGQEEQTPGIEDPMKGKS